MELKEFAKIGKGMLRQITSFIESYKIEEEEQNYSLSSKQVTLKETLANMRGLLSDNNIEDVVEETVSNFIYDEDPKQKVSVKHTRLSKSQILQFILYHFLPIDERGVIRGVCEKEIADLLGVSLKTVRNNNHLFEEIGLIYFSGSSEGINIMLIDYPRYFDKDGYGYMELEVSRFGELKGITHVNSLRLELRMELVYDNNEVKRQYKKDNSPCKISFNDFKTFAPKYTHYKGMLEDIIKKGTSSFKKAVENSTIYFVLEQGVQNGKALKEQRKEEYTKFLEEYLQEKGCQEFIQRPDVDSFVQLAFEYSMERVIQALEPIIYKEFVLGELDKTENFGGRVRTAIRQNIAKNTEGQTPAMLTA